MANTGLKPGCDDPDTPIPDDDSCSNLYQIASEKITTNKKRSSDKKCSEYKVNGCKLPNSVFYYSDDNKHNVPASSYKEYKYTNIVKHLKPIKDSKINKYRCECDYLTTYNWAKLGGERLWVKYRKYGLWGDNGINKYLEENNVNEKVRYEIMKLLCEGSNTTNPRPHSFQSPKTFFDTKTTLTVLDFIMALMSLFIIVRATGTYKEYIQKLAGNKNMWLQFILMIFVTSSILFYLQDISWEILGWYSLITMIILFIISLIYSFRSILPIFGYNILSIIIRAIFLNIKGQQDISYKWLFIISFSFFAILMFIGLFYKPLFRYSSIFYMAFLIGTQLWLSIPSPWTEGETAGVFEFFAIILQKAGILDYVPKMLFGDSIKSTSGPKWNVPLIPATIMMINALLGVGKSPADLISGYKSKMRKMSKRSDIDVFQIDADIGDIGF